MRLELEPGEAELLWLLTEHAGRVVQCTGEVIDLLAALRKKLRAAKQEASEHAVDAPAPAA